MRRSQSININQLDTFKQQLLRWANTFEVAVYLDSNLYPADKYSRYECLVAVALKFIAFDTKPNCFAQLKKLHQQTNDWLFGMISYDAKNEVEPNLCSNNFDGIEMPMAYFFCPDIVVAITKDQQITIHWLDEQLTAQQIKQQIEVTELNHQTNKKIPIALKARIDKKTYLHKVKQIQAHIKRGNVYEANLCQEFYAQNVQIDAATVFEALNKQTQAPFAAFFKNKQQYILCASPERYLQKSGNTLISQPIKGTIKRGQTDTKDEQLKQQLRQSPKEQAENVMIVDLVRNDLSRIAQQASVQVAELFEVYSFKTVHHLISTISATLPANVHFTNALQATFPIGSMTGAPKISALQIIEQLEETKRGMYAGTIGYVSPQSDFDFNVVIRSLLYNQDKAYLSLQTGSAITHYAIPEQEYNECLLKAHVIRKIMLDYTE